MDVISSMNFRKLDLNAFLADEITLKRYIYLLSLSVSLDSLDDDDILFILFFERTIRSVGSRVLPKPVNWWWRSSASTAASASLRFNEIRGKTSSTTIHTKKK